MDRNEAIKVVKDNWPESRHQLKEALQTLIPELQESEDESIRKELLQKELLLKDLCERLPYGIFVKENRESLDDSPTIYTFDYHPCIDNCKPYLRPMSSMTEEEDREWQVYKNNIACSCDKNLNERVNELHDWFNRKGFDYRGLIPMGLALEAPEDMYKI